MDKQEYQKVVDTIKTPPQLKTETLKKMEDLIAQKGTMEIPPEKASGFKRFPVMPAFVAAAAVLILTVSWSYLHRDIVVSDLEPGVHDSYVELTDGYLNFKEMQADRVFEHGTNWGGELQKKVSWTPEEFYENTGAQAVREVLPGEYAIESQEVIAYYSLEGGMENAVLREEFQNEAGGVIVYQASLGAQGLPEGFPEEVNSRIADQDLTAAYDRETDTYYAYAEEEGVYYLFSLTGMEEKAAVEILFDFFGK